MLRRGRHIRRPRLPVAALPVVVVGAALGASAFFVSRASADEVPTPPRLAYAVVPRRLGPSALVAPPPSVPAEGEVGRIDTAWRNFEDSVEMRFALAPPDAGSHPSPPDGSGEGRRIVYSNSEQRVWLVDDADRVLDSYPVSGRSGIPAPGTYAVFSKSELAWAGHDGITMRYMVRFAHGVETAIGFHSIPLDRHGRPLQTEEDLGSFRSAGCVRQALGDAVELYHWADPGTTVVVTA